jgi:hypothetical protein
VNLSLGSFRTEMKRCRGPSDPVAGVLAGDFSFFAAKMKVFLPGNGFDHETQSRYVFDSGGDIFSNPMVLDFVAAASNDVSYAYFNETGKLMLPIFSEALTVSMSNRLSCPRENPSCFQGKELRYRRYVSVGRGDVASALAGFYRVRGIQTGTVLGRVVDLRTREPISRMDVFVFKVPDSWQGLSDGEISARSYDALVEANLAVSRTAENPLGEVGLVSQFRTDVGLDVIPDGSFEGPLPPGRYVLATRDQSRPVSRLFPIRVAAGQTTVAFVVAGEGGVIEYQVQDAAGRKLPSKLTLGHCFPECGRNEDCSGADPVCDPLTHLCVPAAGYRDAKDCRPDQQWDSGARTCRCPATGLLPLALGGKRFADGTVRTVLSADGQGTLHMEPGTYQVIVSRGIEYEISKQFVTVVPGTVTRIRAVLPRVVDTKGWISADFHAHGPNSVDSGLDYPTRVVSYAAEGVELLSSSDHDWLTDYAPTIYDLRLEPWLRSQIGMEVSPLDYGHFIGFPLLFDHNQELYGGFHWRADNPGGSPGWRNLPPGEIFRKLRELGSLGPDRTAVFIAHFYDNFTFYDLDPWTLEVPSISITSIFNPVLGSANFSGEFDALEGLNGKNLDTVRRPTAKEVRDYNLALNDLFALPGLSYEERQRRWAVISTQAQREFLRRTPAEQAKGLTSPNPNFACRCSADADCGPGSVCDDRTGGCLPGCTANASCNAQLVAAGREACLPIGGNAARRQCQRTAPSCQADGECTVVWGGQYPERCLAADPSRPAQRTCETPCPTGSTCARLDPLRPVCDSVTNRCVAIAPVADVDPCPTLRGTVDDWFQMLNRGMRRTFLGNSDSHSTYDTEAGIPRNYVRSEAELPIQIRPEDVAREVQAGRVLVSYGPFVELWVDGKEVGSTVAIRPGAEVTLRLRVQGASWYDVDRIEIYRNGELWREIDGRVDCPRGSATCIKVPGREVVKYEGTFTDAPPRDAWYVVLAMGLEGRSMAPVYSSTPLARLGAFELIQRLTPLLPPLRSLRIPFSPTISTVRPFAMTNPIWVDVGGDGFTPLAPLPGWATPKDRQLVTGASALTEAGASGKAPAHDHHQGLGRLRGEAHEFMHRVRRGELTEEMILKAVNALRYLR